MATPEDNGTTTQHTFRRMTPEEEGMYQRWHEQKRAFHEYIRQGRRETLRSVIATCSWIALAFFVLGYLTRTILFWLGG